MVVFIPGSGYMRSRLRKSHVDKPERKVADTDTTQTKESQLKETVPAAKAKHNRKNGPPK